VWGKKRQQASPRCGFREPSTPKEALASRTERRYGRREEGGRRTSFCGGRRGMQASPRCGFRGTLAAEASAALIGRGGSGGRKRGKEELREEEEAAGFA
jgi:hypothetical protein